MIKKQIAIPEIEKRTMQQNVEFICEWISEKYTITELCKEFVVSHPTAYKLINLDEKLRVIGLSEILYAPKLFFNILPYPLILIS